MNCARHSKYIRIHLRIALCGGRARRTLHRSETAGVLINIITKNSPLSVVSKFWLFRMATLRGLY